MFTTANMHLLPSADDPLDVSARRQDASQTVTVNLRANYGNQGVALSFDDLNEALLFAGHLTAALQELR